MAPSKITLDNGKEYSLKHTLTVRQVRTARENLGNLIGFSERLKSAIAQENNAEIEKITSDLLGKTNYQDQLLLDFIVDCLGLTQQDIDNMEYLEAAMIFDKLFEVSTTIPKKSVQPYG